MHRRKSILQCKQDFFIQAKTKHDAMTTIPYINTARTIPIFHSLKLSQEKKIQKKIFCSTFFKRGRLNNKTGGKKIRGIYKKMKSIKSMSYKQRVELALFIKRHKSKFAFWSNYFGNIYQMDVHKAFSMKCFNSTIEKKCFVQ